MNQRSKCSILRTPGTGSLDGFFWDLRWTTSVQKMDSLGVKKLVNSILTSTCAN
ncbi:hypothetical protein [Bdellovibrio sp. BCCA]|uniref:hypothetical protein n=1 Tax=Bdellovibrio sp. BCCA TaxID=3136281 RepID=UPI0030F0BDC5